MRIGIGRRTQLKWNIREPMGLLEPALFHLGIWGLSVFAMVLVSRPPPHYFTFYSIMGVIVAGVIGPPFYYFLFRPQEIWIAAQVHRDSHDRPIQAAIAAEQKVKAKKSPKPTVIAVKEKAKVKKAIESKPVEERGIAMEAIRENFEILEEYWIHEPYSKVIIARMPDSGIKYFVEEVRLNMDEYQAYKKLSEILTAELNPIKIGKEKDIRKAIVQGAEALAKKYKHTFRQLAEGSWERILYFLQRDMLGFGPINTIMDDVRVEDISCDGVGSPIFVWHRRFESIPANITFIDRDVLDEYIIKLAHKSGKHVSSAYPIVDAMLYGRHRLAASFRDEVSPKGSTFTVRKFKEEPLSVIDLIEVGTLSPEIAAYLWVLIENKTTIMVMGGTGSGKTTTLNVLATLVKGGMKLVTVEETAELNFPHENWVQLISRESFGLTGSKIGQISLYDLVRMSLRYRPDYLIVGEVRGEEAFVLFQALATGHGGLSTVHAENLEYLVKRLTSPPMNISESYVPLMNIAVLIERTPLATRGEGGPSFGRRLRNLWEVIDFGKYISVAEWIPERDAHEVNLSQSYYLNKIALKTGKRRLDLIQEVTKRTQVLKWMLANNVRNVKDVAQVILDYYANPDIVLGRTVEPQPPLIKGEEAIETSGEAPNPLLEAIISEGGSIDVERAIRVTKLDTISFWNNVDMLRSSGYIITGEKSEQGLVKTYLVATDLGQRAYRRIPAGEVDPK